MGTLTSYLQQSFAAVCPPQWICQYEVALFGREIADVLGYAPRADVLLTRMEDNRRLWIEFEISRADPVANHAKFATGHLFHPVAPTDTFVAMVSPHVNRGRRNLAAATITLMRSIGMDAFQTTLLPHLTPQDIKRLNHLDHGTLANEGLRVQLELDRVFAIAEPVTSTASGRLHFVGDLFEVMMNIRQWNLELSYPDARAAWGKRTVTYFVADPRTKQFAPSKYCAYLTITAQNASPVQMTTLMTVDRYAQLDSTKKLFDGHKARVHLTNHLAMRQQLPHDVPSLLPAFRHWLSIHSQSVSVHPAGPILLVPPDWF